MLISPEKLDAAISAYEDAIIALASAQSYTINTGISNRTVTRANLPEIQDTLLRLQQQKSALTGKATGRTFAKQGGRG